MGIVSNGPWHRWFAWRPVNTLTYGWRWLTTVERRRWLADVPGAPAGWDYRPQRRVDKRGAASVSAESEVALKRSLVKAREKAGLTQSDLAARLGLDLADVREIERLDSDPRLSAVRQYLTQCAAYIEWRVGTDRPEETSDVRALAKIVAEVGLKDIQYGLVNEMADMDYPDMSHADRAKAQDLAHYARVEVGDDQP